MLLFQPPTPTRYDLNFSVAGIPVRVHPLFWVIALLFGSASSDLIQILIWVVVVFLSILVHELGHALAMRRYGLSSNVILYWGGGLTVPEQVKWGYSNANVSLRPNQEIFISLAGPFSGFLVAGLILAGVAAAGGEVFVRALFGVLPVATAILPINARIPNLFVATLLWVNIFWGYINLMPVYPLDGGNVARYLLLQADPWNGIRRSLWVSVVTGAIIAVLGLILRHNVFIALLFGFLAFQSYQSVRGRM